MSKVADNLENLCQLPDALLPMREEILANVVMLSQIPAPTGEEEQRSRFLLDRFAESGLPEAGPDEKGNAVGFLPGQRGERTIMLVAHLDTIFPKTVDHNISVQEDRVIGPGVSDNAAGAAVMSLLPRILDRMDIHFNCDLQLIGTVHSLHRGDHEGLRFFLEHAPRRIDFGIVVEGVELGRLNFFSVGVIRGDITCDVRPENLRRYGSESALIVLNQILNRILAIPTPTRPYTVIRIGRMRSGVLYNKEPDHAELGFEVVSDSDKIVRRVVSEIEDIVAETTDRSAVDAQIDCFFHRDAGGIPYSHPLVRTANNVMSQLGIQPDQEYDPSEVSEFIAYGIPAVTLGMTTTDVNEKKTDHVLIDPILNGVAQLIGVIAEMDRGACDER